MRPGWSLLLVMLAGGACNRQREATQKEVPAVSVVSVAGASVSAPSPALSAASIECKADVWLDYGHDARRTFQSAECVEGPLTPLWKAQPTTPVKERPPAFEHVVATDEGLYATGIRGKSSMLHGVELNSSPRWDYDTRTDLHFAYWPIVAHDVVGMNDDGAFFLDLKTGKMRINQGLDSWGQMAADKERFYWTNSWHVHGPALYLGAFSSTGESLWKQSKYGGSAPMDMMDDLGGVALDGALVFQASNYKFASFSGIFCFDTVSGQKRWIKNSTPIGYLSAADGQVFVVERVQRERRVVARSQRDGETSWSVSLKGALGAAPAVARGLVLVGTDKGELVALEAASGKERWRFEGGQKHAPVIGNETFVAVSANERVLFTIGKEIVMLDLLTGGVRWRGEVATSAVHSPILAGGRVYAVAGGEILALEGSFKNP